MYPFPISLFPNAPTRLAPVNLGGSPSPTVAPKILAPAAAASASPSFTSFNSFPVLSSLPLYQTPYTLAQSQAQQFLKLGEDYYGASRFRHAINALDQYLAVNPNDFQVLNKRGVAKAAKKDYEGALADYNTALSINPNFYNGHINRGNLWVYLGNTARQWGQSHQAQRYYQQALNDYGEAIRINPMHSVAYENRAELFADLGYHTQALNDKWMVIQLQKLKAPVISPNQICPPRIALVLANDDYVGTENDLRGGPIKDAESVASVLQRQGFYVIKAYNQTGPQMKAQVSRFVTQLRNNPGAISMVYYSGHGGAINGNNYLIPTEYTGTIDPNFTARSVSVDSLLKELKFSNSQFNMIFLDACRTPLMTNTPTFKSGKTALKQWETEPGPGLANTWIEYASRPNMPALQSGNEGLYTKYLVQFMARPDLNLKEVSLYTSYALESDPIAQHQNQHARTQTDLSHTEKMAQSFSFAKHCNNPVPHVNPYTALA